MIGIIDSIPYHCGLIAVKAEGVRILKLEGTF
jgi:hypothetical protein